MLGTELDCILTLASEDTEMAFSLFHSKLFRHRYARVE